MCFLKDMVLQNRDCLIRLPLLLTFVCIADVFADVFRRFLTFSALLTAFSKNYL